MSILRLWPKDYEDEFWPMWSQHPHDWFNMPPWGGRPQHHHHHHRRPGPEKWTQAVDMRGFTGDDVTVKMEGNEVIVHGKHDFQDGDNVEKMERRRKVVLPSNVDTENLTTSLSRNGQLLIQAPLKIDTTERDLEEGLLEALENHDIFGDFPRGFQKEGDKVRLRMDVSAYKPEEIKVVVDHHFLKVHAKHTDERGFRESNQSVLLPKGMDENALTSTLSSEGTLTFSAPAIKALPDTDRALAIEHEEPMKVDAGAASSDTK